MVKVRRLAAQAITAAALAVALAGCSSTVAPTQPPPQASATDQPTDAVSPSGTEAPSEAPSSTPEARPSAVVTAEPTTAPTPTPEPTSTPTPGAGSVAYACTGNADHQAFFAETSAKLPFDVYCAALPTGWFLQDAAYVQANGGKLTIDYKGPGGATLAVSEGAFCTTSPADCSPHASIRGTASFGDKPGMLDVLTTPPDVLIVYVAPGTKQAYQISGSNLTQAKFVALAAAMTKVPKS